MDRYSTTSYRLARIVTEDYSTSFSMSSLLLGRAIRPHIYAIYGLVRIADEIVDTYNTADSGAQLDQLETQVVNALTSGYSSNPLVHAFATTARRYHIDTELIAPFFVSMRRDLSPVSSLSTDEYDTYIYGSAEVVGLMCLKVFVEGDQKAYDELRAGASALGRAYQKVNFLRDLGADADQLGRWYFPIGSAETFNDDIKNDIITDIEKDFAAARVAIPKLPTSARKAVATSYAYYSQLLAVIKATPADILRHSRVRVPNSRKIALLVKARLGVSVL